MDTQSIITFISNNAVPIALGVFALIVGVKIMKGIGKLVVFGVAALLIAKGLGVF